jgi:peptide/nickel transport system substrate-binding protein
VNLIINRESPPFDNPKIRRALALTLDRKAFIDILSEGEAKVAGIMLPPPDGAWGLTEDKLKDVPGYGDLARAREEAKKLMQERATGPTSG